MKTNEADASAAQSHPHLLLQVRISKISKDPTFPPRIFRLPVFSNLTTSAVEVSGLFPAVKDNAGSMRRLAKFTLASGQKKMCAVRSRLERIGIVTEGRAAETMSKRGEMLKPNSASRSYSTSSWLVWPGGWLHGELRHWTSSSQDVEMANT